MSAPQEIRRLGLPPEVVGFQPTIEPKPQGPSCKIPDIKQFSDSVDRYETDLVILSKLLEFEGIKTNEVLERERREAVEIFRQSDRGTKIETHRVVIGMIEAKLPQHLRSQLALRDELLAEGGLRKDTDDQRGLQHRSRLERYEVLIGLKSDNDRTLTERMPSYIQELKEILIRTGRSAVEVDAEIGLWTNRYNIAQDEIKPKVANRLRLYTKSAVRREFKSLLMDYSFLAFAYGNKKPNTILPDAWQSTFDEAGNPDKEIDIVSALRDIVEKRREELKFKLATVQIPSSIT